MVNVDSTIPILIKLGQACSWKSSSRPTLLPLLLSMNCIAGPSRGINQSLKGGDEKKGGGAKFKGKCDNCGKPGHKSKDCAKPKAVQPVGNVARTHTADKKN